MIVKYCGNETPEVFNLYLILLKGHMDDLNLFRHGPINTVSNSNGHSLLQDTSVNVAW